jgi:hypothetical protein
MRRTSYPVFLGARRADVEMSAVDFGPGNQGSFGADGVPAGRQSIPVVSGLAASLSAGECDRLARIAVRLATSEPALSSTSFFGAQVQAGLSDGPAVLIGDHREIALASETEAQLFEYRVSHLGADGDMLLLGGMRNAAFERYRQEFLGLGWIDVIALPSERFGDLVPLAARCRSSAAALDRVVARACSAGNLTIVPHIGRGSAWMLAAEVAERSGAPVHVAAPPPRLTRRVNDKVWFAHRVNEVLGPRAQPPFRAVFGPVALAAHVRRLARQSERLVIKVPDSAGSAGNLSLSSSAVQDSSAEALRENLGAMLRAIDSDERYPLLVEIWDAPVLASPSVQIWIPDRRAGPPVLEGVFEQVASGPQSAFVGSVPATFPDFWGAVIGEEALRLATLFQLLGYFGRCSFDALIAGSDYANAVLHWLECNGRWGGVSIPMTLANRLAAGGSRGNFVVVQREKANFPPCRFSTAVGRLEPILYRAGQSREGIVLISPLGLERGSAVQLMALAEDVERATNLAAQATAIVTGWTS